MNAASAARLAAVRRLVIASNNPGKLREIGHILAPLGIDVAAQSSYGVTEAEEPHDTFVENALAKARHAARHTGLPALADDSGICVDALGGAPGVRSARYAEGGDTSIPQDERNNRKLLAALDQVDMRSAHYYCVIVLVRRHDDPQPLIAEAEWRGAVMRAPRGEGGFGYDPLFLLPELGLTAAELPSETKNRLSHRGKALALLADRLRALQLEP
jgi:XTP/dITP diphosphohydrolase